jgi:hypothetical protein
LLPASCWSLAWLTLLSWRWKRHVPPKCRLTFNGLQGVIFHTMTTAVRTSNPAMHFKSLSLTLLVWRHRELLREKD